MEKEKIIKYVVGIVSIIIIVFSLITMLGIINKKKNTNIDKIPDNYIATFHGGGGEITFQTYIYKIDNNKENYGFKYINSTSTTKSWGSSETVETITKKGEVNWTDEVFKVAKENSAYSYVTLPKDDKTYSIEEYQNMFIMN